ncbi:MAG TPA: hypothetical protein VE866_10520 [Candidatus Binatia bacterium]|nr:hypothetical protein [Candidatus Binatia bacterium]
MSDNPQRIEATIKRLSREIDEIDNFFYAGLEGDRGLYASMLERKRDDMVRSAVLQMHTAIESLLDLCIIFKITGRARRLHPSRNEPARALHRILYGGGSLGFDMKLNVALALRLISRQTKERLAILNTLRNKCSHNWVLKAPVRHGKRPAQKKPPLLLYEGRDLHTVAVLKDFASEYGGVYLRLFMKIPYRPYVVAAVRIR